MFVNVDADDLHTDIISLYINIFTNTLGHLFEEKGLKIDESSCHFDRWIYDARFVLCVVTQRAKLLKMADINLFKLQRILFGS